MADAPRKPVFEHNPDLPAFCFYQEFAPSPLATLAFDRDYLMYSVKGAIRLGVEEKRWVLPPSFAAWVPAQTPLQVEITHPTQCCSALFKPGFAPEIPNRTIVFAMPPVAREMIHYSRRWGPNEAEFSEYAQAYFRTLALLCADLAATPSDIWRPVAQRGDLTRAITFTEENLGSDITAKAVARAAGLSERTLLRRFTQEIGVTWAQSLRRLRMIRAVELLCNEDLPIVQVGFAVGYRSLSAFNKAFREFSGLTPSTFRERHRDGFATSN